MAKRLAKRLEQDTQMIENDLNGAFVRASREAGADQTETVHAIQVTYQGGTVEWWNVQPRPFSKIEVDDMRQRAYRFDPASNGKRRRVLDVEAVSREVTISAGPWIAADAG